MSERMKNIVSNLPRRAEFIFTMPRKDGTKHGRMTERRLLAVLKRSPRKLHLRGKLHTLRHFFVSHAIEQGVPVLVVQQIVVGHVDPRILRRCTHISAGVAKRAIECVFGADEKAAVHNVHSMEVS